MHGICASRSEAESAERRKTMTQETQRISDTQGPARDNPPPEESRDRVIVRTSLVGIAANLLLAGFKAAVGLLSHSIAVVLDALNNLSDALSSVVTIIGARFAAQKPDREHPLGHGRAEYLSALAVSAIVLYAGITALVESVKKILHPTLPDYRASTLVVLVAAVVVKLLLGRYVKRTGERINSGSLTASGSDALYDAILSASVLFSAVIFLLWHVNLEAWVGVIIAVFIIHSGREMLTETVDDILGKRMDRELVSQLKKTICEDECVSGAYDLLLHSYGPELLLGSVHVEVPDTMTADEIDVMERRIAQRVYQKHGVVLTGIGIYSVNSRSEGIRAIRTEVTRLVMGHDGVLQMHGFYADLEKKTISLDVILDFAVDNREALFGEIQEEVQKAFPDYELRMNMDVDV